MKSERGSKFADKCNTSNANAELKLAEETQISALITIVVIYQRKTKSVTLDHYYKRKASNIESSYTKLRRTQIFFFR